MTSAAYKPETSTPRSSAETKPSGSTSNTLKGHCPECGPDRYADIVAEHEERYDSVDMWATNCYYILRCGGCKAMYVLNVYESSEDIIYEHDPVTDQTEPKPKPHVTYWPSPAKRKRPEWLYKLRDPYLSNILREVYEALNADHHILAAIGVRTALERTFVLMQAKGKSFEQRLGGLKDLGKIIDSEEQQLLILTDAGNAAAHRAWEPKPEQLMTLIDAMETFLHRVLVIEREVNAIKEHIPQPQHGKKPKPQPGG